MKLFTVYYTITRRYITEIWQRLKKKRSKRAWPVEDEQIYQKALKGGV